MRKPAIPAIILSCSFQSWNVMSDRRGLARFTDGISTSGCIPPIAPLTKTKQGGNVDSTIGEMKPSRRLRLRESRWHGRTRIGYPAERDRLKGGLD